MSADEPIQLAPPDPAWPARFELERKALEGVIGEWICGGIHHVGSTAVSGLEAKPTIDILVGVSDLESARSCFEPLAGLGYLYAPYLPEEMHWFCKPDPARRTHHLHLVPVGSRRYREELAFRDRLRTNPRLAAGYAALKRELAERHREDREAYTEAKGAFIQAALSEEDTSWG
ncbi:MAG TPA: GrpB family protein [Solirubrobacterales bacterium]|nr:GrpB family protein [Solirubrobacterales bacterium]